MTGDGKSDALVLVNQGGSAGRIALYIYSSHRAAEQRWRRRRTAADPSTRTSACTAPARALKQTSAKRPNGAVVYRQPIFDPGDDPGRPRRWRGRRGALALRRVALRRREPTGQSTACARASAPKTATSAPRRSSRQARPHLPRRSAQSRSAAATPSASPRPTATQECRFFTLRRIGDEYLSRVRWKANFPDGGPGRYQVRLAAGPAAARPGARLPPRADYER